MEQQTKEEAQIDAVEVLNPNGQAAAVFVCEHASNYIPERFNNLGIGSDAISSHIAWDIGALKIARWIAKRLDAPLVASKISRLVYDCNRAPQANDVSPAKSELYEIPGNINIDAKDRQWREQHVYRPFKNKLAEVIACKIQSGLPPAVITLHSFTPVYYGKSRSVEIGVIHDTDARLADRILADSGNLDDYLVRRNEPYSGLDNVNHTLRLHGINNGLANVMIEIRNDLLRDKASITKLAGHLSTIFENILGGNRHTVMATQIKETIL